MLKRKRDSDEVINPNVLRKSEPKKPKKSKKPNFRNLDDCKNLDLNNSISLSIGKLNSELAADFVAQRNQLFNPSLSPFELHENYIPASSFCDASDWEKPRILEYMPEFLRHYSPRGKESLTSISTQSGCPRTLVLAAAGLRAADITRVLRSFQTDISAVAKLFAKHIKLSQAIDFVKKTRIGIGIGTPSRIIDLVDAGALSISSLEQIVIDASHIDQKRRSIFDMRETQEPLMRLLHRSSQENVRGSKAQSTKIVLY